MACNAVSVVRAAVTNEQLLGLLTPDLVCQIVKAALADQRYQAEPRVLTDGSVYASAGYGNSVIVRAGQVRVDAYDRALAQRLGDAVAGALSQAGDALLASQVAATIAKIAGKRPVIRQVQVEESGVVMAANVFTVRIGG